MHKEYDYESLKSDYTNYIAFLELQFKEYYKKSRKSIFKKDRKWYYEKAFEIYKRLANTCYSYYQFEKREKDIIKLESDIISYCSKNKIEQEKRLV